MLFHTIVLRMCFYPQFVFVTTLQRRRRNTVHIVFFGRKTTPLAALLLRGTRQTVSAKLDKGRQGACHRSTERKLYFTPRETWNSIGLWSISCSIWASLAWKPVRISRDAVSSGAAASSTSSCAFSGLWGKHPRRVGAGLRCLSRRQCGAPLGLRKQLLARLVPRGEVRRADRHLRAREVADWRQGHTGRQTQLERQEADHRAGIGTRL